MTDSADMANRLYKKSQTDAVAASSATNLIARSSSFTNSVSESSNTKGFSRLVSSPSSVGICRPTREMKGAENGSSMHIMHDVSLETPSLHKKNIAPTNQGLKNQSLSSVNLVEHTMSRDLRMGANASSRNLNISKHQNLSSRNLDDLVGSQMKSSEVRMGTNASSRNLNVTKLQNLSSRNLDDLGGSPKRKI